MYNISFQVPILVITHGILFGGGSSLVYAPSLVILGHYFRRHIGLVNGLVATGSSVFTIALPHILKVLLEEFGVNNYRIIFSNDNQHEKMLLIIFKDN